MKNKYIIIPGCSDLNRGDQALVWETKRIAEECGYAGDYYLTSESTEPVHQSIRHNINIISPVIEHPSRIFKNKDNINYNAVLKFKWGVIALIDLLRSLLLLNSVSRAILFPLLKRQTKNTLYCFKESNAVFFKGGGIIHSYGGVTSFYYIYFALYHIYLASALGKPVYVMPNSFGPFEGFLVKFLVKKAFIKCRLVTTRETFSQKMIKRELGLKFNNYPDLAFYLPDVDLDKNAVFLKYDLPKDRKLVAITMRPHRFPKSRTPSDDYVRFKKEMADFIKWLHCEGFMPVLIEHTMAINSHENDGKCIAEVIEYLDGDEYRFVSDTNYTCYELKALYGLCDYIAGTRFHSVIFSFSNKIPGIAITYAGNKAQGIMNDMDLADLSVSIDEFTCDLLKTKFTYVLNNKEQIIGKISTYINNVTIERNNLKTHLKQQ